MLSIVMRFLEHVVDRQFSRNKNANFDNQKATITSTEVQIQNKLVNMTFQAYRIQNSILYRKNGLNSYDIIRGKSHSDHFGLLIKQVMYKRRKMEPDFHLMYGSCKI